MSIILDPESMTAAALAGFECALCGQSFLSPVPVPSQPVGTVDGGQIFACVACVRPDRRFTAGLIHDVHQVLEAHGYRLPEGEQERDRARGASVTALLRLVRAYEGREGAR